MKQTALLLALLLLAPMAMAGSESNPEISDASDDQVSSIPMLGASATDISKGWVGEETPEDFTIYLKVDATPNPDPTETIDYDLTLGGVDFGGEVTNLGPDLTVTPTGVATAFDASGSTLSFTIPRSEFGALIPGQELTGFTSFVQAYLLGSETTIVWNEQDTAPDSGSGRAYIVGSNAAPGMDYDEDGLDDADEIRLGSDPTVQDTDGDGLTDGFEAENGTDPANPDTDGDNLNDGDEFTAGTNATNPDTDGDGLGDGNETGSPLLVDTDGDGLDDWEESQAGTDPNKTDTDGDGLDDKYEVDNNLNPISDVDGKGDPDGDGVNTTTEILQGSNPFVADQEEADDVLLGQKVPFELPGDLQDWFWILVLILLIALLVFLIVLLIRVLGKKKDDEEEEAEPEALAWAEDQEEDTPEESTASTADDELTEEQIATARRLFEERERRYLDYVAPDRDRRYDDPIAPLTAEDLEGAERTDKERKALAKQEAKAAKQEAKEAKKREKALAKLAKKEAKAAES